MGDYVNAVGSRVAPFECSGKEGNVARRMVDFVGTGMIGSVGIAAGWRKFFSRFEIPHRKKEDNYAKKCRLSHVANNFGITFS